MSQFPENVTLLLLNWCHVMPAEQPTTFGVFLGMVHGFVKAAWALGIVLHIHFPLLTRGA